MVTRTERSKTMKSLSLSRTSRLAGSRWRWIFGEQVRLLSVEWRRAVVNAGIRRSR
ncbi:hypothetical protein ACFLWO_03995 [Chloroflexota bacterium]